MRNIYKSQLYSILMILGETEEIIENQNEVTIGNEYYVHYFVSFEYTSFSNFLK